MSDHIYEKEVQVGGIKMTERQAEQFVANQTQMKAAGHLAAEIATVHKEIGALNHSLSALRISLEKSGEGTTKLSRSLNWLTGIYCFLTLVGVAAACYQAYLLRVSLK